MTEKYKKIKDMKFDVITMIELIEHLPLEQVPLLAESVFGFYRPKNVIITTPNSDFNQHFIDLGSKWEKG